MLNPIDSFFQYYVKRMFNVLYFLSKKNALPNADGQILFFIMSVSFLNLFTQANSISYKKARLYFLKYSCQF